MIPLVSTAAAVDRTNDWLSVRFGWPEESDDGWWRCDAVDAAHLVEWEGRIAAYVTRTYARSHPMTVAGFALDFYASVPGVVGGACFRQHRRVPRLGREVLAFRAHPEEEYPASVALLDDRFWCLPTDPEAGHPSATVVPDEAALAAVLRAQVRAHADAFLAGYASGARLPRRHLLGAFFDALDTGVWYGGEPGIDAADEVLAVTRTALPGRVADFSEASSVHVLTDDRGRTHLTRRRIGCCYYFKVSAGGEPCGTCPRVDDRARAARYAAEPD